MTTRVAFTGDTGAGGSSVARIMLSQVGHPILNNGTPTILEWDTTDFADPTGTFTITLPSPDVTVHRPGLLLVNTKASIAWAAGMVEVDLENTINGAGIDENSYSVAGAGFSPRLPVFDMWPVSAGDIINTTVTVSGASTALSAAITEIVLLF